MIEILLTQGQVALIDDEDYELVSQYKWHAVKDTNTYYACAYVKRSGYKKIRMHRLIVKASSELQVDHIDGNGLNNQKKNLRLANNAQNHHNLRRVVEGTSKYKGVYKHTVNKNWIARITYEGKIVHLGVFKIETDAALAYNKAAVEHFGEFAFINDLGA
jgi:DNA polymerase III alpha subunit